MEENAHGIRISMCIWKCTWKMHMEFPHAFGNAISKFEMAFQNGRFVKVQRRATMLAYRYDEIHYEERLRGLHLASSSEGSERTSLLILKSVNFTRI